MKRDKDKELDDLFKNGLGEPPNHAAYQEGDWDALEQMLDGPKKTRGLVFWLPVLSAAAMLLVALGWWLFAPIATHEQQQQVAGTVKTAPKDSAAKTPADVKVQPQVATAPKPEKANLGQADAVTKDIKTQTNNQIAVVPKPEKANLGQAAALHNAVKAQTNNQLAVTPKSEKANLGQADALRKGVNPQIDIQIAASPKPEKANLGQADAVKNNLGNANDNKATVNTQVLANNNTSTKAVSGTDSSVLAANKANGFKTTGNREMDSIIKANNTEVIASAKPKVAKSAGDNHITMALSVIGAPEINGVGSLSDNMRGTNFGALFSVGFRRLSLSTGATYATKPYGSTYDQSSTQYAVRGYLDGIADCRVLDIPINLDYKLVNGRQNKFSVGTGISSYIMLHESYLYNYIDPSISPSTYTVPNVHKYMFSILNLQATYTRQLSPKFGFSVQPYMKLPLEKIGNGQAKLQSAGVALGVNWTLNPSRKR